VNVTIQNNYGVAIIVGGVAFEPGESRDITALYEGPNLASEPVLDATSNAELAETMAGAMDGGDLRVISPAIPPDVAPSTTITPASLYAVDSQTAAFVFRGEVGTPSELASVTDPQTGDYAAVQSTGTLWQYRDASWEDTEEVAVFQNWIPPVSPRPLPENQGQITPDLRFTKDVAIQASTGITYPIGPTNAGYNVRGLVSEEVIANPGDYFEFPALVINRNQGFGLASAADCVGNGPNQNGVPIPGLLFRLGNNNYSGRSVMAYFTGTSAWTYGAQNGGFKVNGSAFPTPVLQAAGLFTTGATVRVGLDEQYRFYFGVVIDQEVKVVFRSENPLPTQNYKFVWTAYFFDAVLSQLPNIVTSVVPPAYTDTHYVQFDGVDEYVTFADSTPISAICDLTQDWTIGFKLANTWNPEGRDAKFTVVRNGQNSFYIRGANTANAAPYVQNGILYSGQNTWRTLVGGDRVVVTYTASEQRFRYYKNGSLVGGGWTLRAGLTNRSDGTLSLAEGGGWASYLAGGLDDVFFVGRPISASEAAEAAAGGNPETWTFYDDIIDFMLMGEGTFPTIDGLKGTLEGTLQNGEPEDFVEY